jgi:hypothetical protein
LAAANPFSTTAAAAVSRSACSQPASLNVSNSNRPPDCAAAGSAEPDSRQVVSKGTAPCLSARAAAKNGAAGPDEAAAAMVSTIATELGPLAAPAQQDPTMLIGKGSCNACVLIPPPACVCHAASAALSYQRCRTQVPVDRHHEVLRPLCSMQLGRATRAFSQCHQAGPGSNGIWHSEPRPLAPLVLCVQVT